MSGGLGEASSLVALGSVLHRLHGVSNRFLLMSLIWPGANVWGVVNCERSLRGDFGDEDI